MPLLEPETVVLKLKEMGCPYPAEDFVRATTWLEGYKAGYNKASEDAIEHLEAVKRG